MMKKVSYEEIPEFQRDFKKLLKKYPSLTDDLKLVKVAAIELFHIHKINNLSVFPIPNFCSEEMQVCKIKKFACKSLKWRGSRSGIRVIYAFRPQRSEGPSHQVPEGLSLHTTTLKVDFIEIYFKADQENENRGRIKTYLQSI